jgi:hypothetical protein
MSDEQLDIDPVAKVGSPKIKPSAEQDFINERTRDLMVEWADLSLRPTFGSETKFATSVQFATEEYVRLAQSSGMANVSKAPRAPNADDQIYFTYAISKGWISKDGKRVLAAGFKTAAAFLRR